MRYSGKILKLVVGSLCVIAITQVNSAPVKAAETLVLRFGPVEESLSVTELQNIAKTGKAPSGYDLYLKRLSAKQRQQIIGALRIKLPVSVVALSNLFNTPVGSTLLKDFSTVTTRQDNAGMQALRAAIVLGASDPQGLSVISFIKAYPSQRLQIDLPQVLKLSTNLNKSFRQTQRFFAAIAPQLVSKQPDFKLPFDPSQSGSAQVQVLKLNLKDQSRQRQVPVDIYWSTAATAAKPVIVLSHGLTSVRTDLRYIAEHLASYGYVVAAVEHVGSNEANARLAFFGKKPFLKAEEFLDRPKDISFVLDELARLNRTSNPLQGKLDSDRAVVIGHSFGGGTALSIAGAELQIERIKQQCSSNIATLSIGEGIQCFAQGLPENNYQLRDPRVKRAIALDPTTSILFGDAGLAKVQIPTLVLAASADQTTPALSEQIINFNKIPSPKWLVTVINGTHISAKDPSTTVGQENRPSTSLGGSEVTGQAVDVRKYIKAISLAMVAQLTPEASKYAVFLTPEYAQFASTKAFPIRLVTEIPPDVLAVAKNEVQK